MLDLKMKTPIGAITHSNSDDSFFPPINNRRMLVYRRLSAVQAGIKKKMKEDPLRTKTDEVSYSGHGSPMKEYAS
jgi:hypothetical protein